MSEMERALYELHRDLTFGLREQKIFDMPWTPDVPPARSCRGCGALARAKCEYCGREQETK